MLFFLATCFVYSGLVTAFLVPGELKEKAGPSLGLLASSLGLFFAWYKTDFAGKQGQFDGVSRQPDLHEVGVRFLILLMACGLVLASIVGTMTILHVHLG